MTRRTVSANAEKHLSEWLEALMAGEIQLWGLPPCVAAFYHAGHEEGRESRQSEIDQLTQRIRALEHQLDGLYLAAFSPKDRRAEYLRRLDDHFRKRDADFFAEPEQLNSKNSPIGAGNLPDVERRPHDGSTQARDQRAA